MRFDKGILGYFFSRLIMEFVDSKFTLDLTENEATLDLNVKGMLWRAYQPKPIFQLTKLKKHSHISAVSSVERTYMMINITKTLWHESQICSFPPY